MTRRLFDRVVRRLELPEDRAARARTLIDTEWLVTNGIGGYSSSSIAGVITRRYHGILVAALPNPLGRMVMLNHVGEKISAGGVTTMLNGEDRVGGKIDAEVAAIVTDVRLEGGLPVWEYSVDGVKIEKRVIMPHKQNTVHISYRLLAGPPTAMLTLKPAVHFRGYEDRVDTERNAPLAKTYAFTARDDLHEITTDGSLPPLRLLINGAKSMRFDAGPHTISENLYPVEESRGYEFVGALWAPGHFDVEIERDKWVTLVASCEAGRHHACARRGLSSYGCEQERRRRLVDSALPQAQDETGAELVLAADQFIITPKGRIVDATRAAAMGNEIRTVIAGYHWFTDWGRDTMISLEGLTLMTGRDREAAFILRTFAHYVRDGLIPNMFPDGSNDGLYHTADATLWFFHAVEAYVRRDGRSDDADASAADDARDRAVPHRGHAFRHRCRSEGRPAEAGRRGLSADMDGCEGRRLGRHAAARQAGRDQCALVQRAAPARGLARGSARRGRAARRSPRAPIGCMRPSISVSGTRRRATCSTSSTAIQRKSRSAGPNQLFSISLDHPVLERGRWDAVLEVVQERLLTPVGLRSLAPGEPNYKSRYFGDLRARDAAYHQGTVWMWLIGPWIDAWLKVHPDDQAGARRFLDGCVGALDAFGSARSAEVFDAEPPYTPRGCIAQAWSVAEVLRSWVKTAPLQNVEPMKSAHGELAVTAKDDERESQPAVTAG